MTRKSFPRQARVRQRREFRRIYENGIRVASRSMVLFGIPKRREEGSRLGVTVTRRIGCAVVRSRCKRRLRELFRQRFTTKRNAFELVINAKPGCVTASWEELVKEFDRAVRQLEMRSEQRQPAREGR